MRWNLLTQVPYSDQVLRSYDDSLNARRVVISGGALYGIINFDFDYVSVNYSDSVTEIYTFKTGGSSGTTSGVITIVYTDSTKDNISSVTRS